MARRPGAGTQPTAGSDEGAYAHLAAADPVLARLLEECGPPPVLDSTDDNADHTAVARSLPYTALLRAIVGQQLSTKAARTIYGRLLTYFDEVPPTPEQVLDAEPEEMRAAAGLSRAKVTYLRSLAEHVISGDLELERLDQLSDEDVISELTAVKGLGLWSAQMFLMFHLSRPDVLPVGDLGIRRAIERAYGLEELPEPAAIERIAEPWRPHRTLACRYLWRSLDNEPG
jgi:DNA-3-methyladenine glycosylase II